MPWFKKRPVHVEAMKFTGNTAETPGIIAWITDGGGEAEHHEARDAWESDDGKVGTPATPEHLSIVTLEGTMQASIDDWIIRGVQGEFYPCKPDIFEQTYEPTNDPA